MNNSLLNLKVRFDVPSLSKTLFGPIPYFTPGTSTVTFPCLPAPPKSSKLKKRRMTIRQRQQLPQPSRRPHAQRAHSSPTASRGRIDLSTNWRRILLIFRQQAPPLSTMQKLLKRTAQAEKQVARRKALRQDIKKRAEGQQDFNKRMQALTDANRALIAARRRRREDYELGSLAPRRDTPVKDANGAYWGSISLNRSMSELGERQRDLACKWAGGVKHLCVKVGDRVAIMQGPDKGQIGSVRAVMEEEAIFVLEGDHLQVFPYSNGLRSVQRTQ